MVDERVRFVRRLLDGETMAALCEEFGISRKTGYKIVQRYQQIGVRGLSDRSRRPYRYANQLPASVETLIVRLKKDDPTWGAPKIRERLRQRWPDIPCPAISTVHAVLDRHGLVTRRQAREAGQRRLQRHARPPRRPVRRLVLCPRRAREGEGEARKR